MTVPPFTPGEYRALIRLTSEKVSDPRSHPKWAGLRDKMSSAAIRKAMTGEST